MIKKFLIVIIKGILYLKGFYEKSIVETKEEKADFKELENYLQELSQNIPSNRIQFIINSIRDKFSEISFDNNDKNYKSYIFPFLNELNNNQEIFYFFKEQKLDGIKDLKEFFLDSDQEELFLCDIDDFIKVIRFLDLEINPINNSFELIHTFLNGICFTFGNLS